MYRSCSKALIAYKHSTICKPCLLRQISVSAKVLSRTSNTKNDSQSEERHSLDINREKRFSELTTAEKVVEGGKTASYLAVTLVGFGITGLLVYFIGRELFSKESPSGVFSEALKLCKKDIRVIDSLGEPIKGYGEMTRRGRRRYTSNTEYVLDGVKHIRMIFYVEGPHRKGTVHLEKKQDENKKYQYIYLIVELEGYPHKLIPVIDNR